MTNRRLWLLIKLLPYTLISFISALVYWILEVGLIGDNLTYPFSDNQYLPLNSLLGVTSMAITLGTGLGYIEETFFKTKFQSRPFIVKIALKTFIYITILLALLFIQSLVLNAVNTDRSIFQEEVINTVFRFFSSITFLSVVIYIGFIIGLTLLISEIIDFIGIDIVGSFFTGKYNKSVEEERIFMFLDMKDSTTIAEKLGHEKHYEFINDYYADMTDAIIETKGHIYQYVGDEIVLSWFLKDGQENYNCINCFFLIKNALNEKKQAYQDKFGIVPAFKAGLHYGKVTRGRVGFIKKELLFTGDVLNTTARIQGMCKELNSDFLVSKTCQELFANSNYEFIDKGSYSLRGRTRKENLVEIRMTEVET